MSINVLLFMVFHVRFVGKMASRRELNVSYQRKAKSPEDEARLVHSYSFLKYEKVFTGQFLTFLLLLLLLFLPRYVLETVLMPHVPVFGYDFFPKAIHLGHMARRMLLATNKPQLIVDKDNYGNKRVELAGTQLLLLFEDAFKTFNADLKRQVRERRNW